MNPEKKLWEDRFSIFAIIFIVFNCLVFNFAHFEMRYSMPLKLLSFIFIIFSFRKYIIRLDELIVFKKFRMKDRS
jgi:hypothetical protein